jgi:hypothetical protein
MLENEWFKESREFRPGTVEDEDAGGGGNSPTIDKPPKTRKESASALSKIGPKIR